MLIQVDVDSTLYDANSLFNLVGREEFGIDWPAQYSFWFKAEDIGTDFDTLLEVFRRCHSAEWVDKQVPYEGAADVLRGIAEDYPDAEIAYVSDRSEALRDPLHAWLTREGFLTNPDQHVAVTNDKRVWMRERRPEIVIDDRVRTILMARYELNAQVLTIKHDYNVNLTGEAEGIYVLPDWKSIGTTLRETAIPKLNEREFPLVGAIDNVVR